MNDLNPATRCVEEQIVALRRANLSVNRLLSHLAFTATSVAVLGGAVRSWHHGWQARDIDIVYDGRQRDLADIVSEYPHQLNQFGGYRALVGGVRVDAWVLESSRIFDREPGCDRTLERLVSLTTFNLDGVAYDLTANELVDGGYLDGMETGYLDMRHEPLDQYRAIAHGCAVLSLHRFKTSGTFPDFCRKRGTTLAEVRAEQRKRYGVPITTARNLPFELPEE